MMTKEEIDALQFGTYRFDGYSHIWEEAQGKRSVRIEINKDDQYLVVTEGFFGHRKSLNEWAIVKARNWLTTGKYEIPASEYRSALHSIHQISASAWEDNYTDVFNQINEICGDILETTVKQETVK